MFILAEQADDLEKWQDLVISRKPLLFFKYNLLYQLETDMSQYIP